MTAFTLTYHTTAGVSSANEEAVCGISDWVIDSPRQIPAGSCGLPSTGTVNFYDIFEIEGDTLRLGEVESSETRSTEALRPTALDDSKSYVKQGG